MTIESIVWRGVHVELPDADRTVLVYMPQAVDALAASLRPSFCRHVYCRDIHARAIASSGDELAADRIYTEDRAVRCML